MIGSATYKILRNLLSPAKPGEKSYADLVDTSKHFKPAPSEIVKRFRFNSRVRKPGESLAAFIAEVRALAEFCNFGDTLEAMLRDRIVCGINDDSIQRRLLSESKLDYAKAVETALNMETAAQSMKTLKNEATDLLAGGDSPAQPQVNRTGTTPSKSGKSKSKGVAPTSDTGTQRPKSRSRIKPVGRVEEESDSNDSKDSSLCLVESKGVVHSPPIKVKMKLDDCVVNMEVDTGAAMSPMSQTTFQGLWPGRGLQPSQVHLRAYTREQIPVVGCCNVNIDYNGQSAQLPLLVVGGSGPTLLGRDWLSQIRLDWHQIHHAHSASLQALLARYPAVFQDGLGKLQGYQAKILVEPNSVPKFNSARSVPYALRDKVDRELQRLQDEGILEPVETAE